MSSAMYCEDCDMTERYDIRDTADGAAVFHSCILGHEVRISLVSRDV
jgi:uncharacterized protein (DUF983 family)